MNKFQLSLIALSLIAITGLTVCQIAKSQSELSFNRASPYYSFYSDSEIDDFQLQLVGFRDEEQLQMIQAFMSQNHKFFTGIQIMKVLLSLQARTYPDYNLSRNNAIYAMKPYIGPLSTAEAIQIFKVVDASDGLASGIITSQVYDLNNNQTNIGNLSSSMAGYGNGNMYQIVLPQSAKMFQYNFLLTSEGSHVGFLIDQSKTMNSIAYTKQDGTNVTRYDLLRQFYYTRFDVFQDFRAFSFALINIDNYYTCKSCSTGSYEQAKFLNSLVQNILKPDGEKDLYLKLSEILSSPHDQLSDLYIWTDAIITEGTKDVSEFIKLINKANSTRRIQIRVNTVSFLLGGEESQSDKDLAINLLKTLSDTTGGTFIQINPQ